MSEVYSVKQMRDRTSVGTFKCNDCGKRYKYKKGLVNHQRYECQKDPQFKCVYCDYRCYQKGSLKTHIFTKHQRIFKQIFNTTV